MFGLNQFNLRPQERRLVVVAAAVLFVVVNVWLVWPHFHDWGKATSELAKAKNTLNTCLRETDTNRVADLQRRLKNLEGQGPAILPTEQSLDLIRAIQNQANSSGVSINSQNEVLTSSATKTNEYFEEKARQISIVSGEKELVDFLVSLGSTNSIIRVRSMVLQPDSTQMRLQGTITLMASYQKNRPKTSSPPPASAAPPALAPPGTRPAPNKKT